ncbi:hypothetical protein M426DRAFT_24738 [Hypoxylon sp. CI-4A]|nr:hypothetical protein M426DRAFT_24738 [Hypoxylon sp. CI-4A]
MTSTLLPFLYQTRTILQANPRTTIAFARSLHITSQRLRDDIPFVSDTPVRRGTITPSERYIFERIFADIKARGLKPTLPEDATAPHRSALHIMEQAARDAGQARTTTATTPGILAGSARNRQRALLRFPPDLRAAASRALDAIQPAPPPVAPVDDGNEIAFDDNGLRRDVDVEEGWKTPSDIQSRAAELEAKRGPERARVEGLIAAAKSDFELWDVLEREVFTMPAKLGIDRSLPEPEEVKPVKKRGRKKKAKDDEAIASEEVSKETNTVPAESYTPSQGLSLYVHGPLYPAYLLLALRRFDTAFRAPSPLAFSLLPRIKELGLESYVLGVSTPFYNELLEIYWSRRGDLAGMLDLLEEMANCGLYFDKQTVSILSQVDSTLTTLATKKTTGYFGRALMTMPEYAHSVRERISDWYRAVEQSVNERDPETGY